MPELTFRLSELDYEVLLGVLKENANEAVIRPLCSSTTLGGSSMGASARRRFSSDESDGGDDADAQVNFFCLVCGRAGHVGLGSGCFAIYAALRLAPVFVITV